MEELVLKYEVARKALISLERLILAISKRPKMNLFIDIEEDSRILRESLIQRFELAVDMLWKYCKVYLLVNKGLRHDSPKSVLRACCVVGLISDEQTEVLLSMVDDRNLTSHMYKESMADKIASSIPGYALIMDKLLKAARP